MGTKKKVTFVLGTRPEAIKLGPVIKTFQERNEYKINVCATGQHREMLKNILPIFNVNVDNNLDLMKNNQSLSGFIARAIEKIDSYLKKELPDIVVVQGDTSSVVASSIASFLLKIPLVHIEAGLRTFNKYSPFPEEMNRVLTSRIADLHISPTKAAKLNLLREGINKENIFVTGNTGVDALLYVTEYIKINQIETETIKKLKRNRVFIDKKIILITGHRRENFGQGFKDICEALIKSAKVLKDCVFIYPVHLNPNVRNTVLSMLSHTENIILLSPVDYITFVTLMNQAYLIITDSGGIQEEAPSLNKPILVMRNTTERPEGIDKGCAKLVGTDKNLIFKNISMLIEDKDEYNRMINIPNPYGDGKASSRILKIISKKYGVVLK